MTSESFNSYLTLGEALVERARHSAHDIAFRFIDPPEASNAEPVARSLSYAQLDERAIAIASCLAEQAEPGDRALVLCQPGAEYVAALFGCFYAGLVAVPAYPPIAAGHDDRLRLLLEDATPRVLLTTELLSALYQGAGLERLAKRAGASIVITDRIEAIGDRDAFRATTADDVAMLQYTSGSTGSPRGVILSYRNLAANVKAFEERLGADRTDRGVLWLPPYHDMGLIGGIFSSVLIGVETVSISPLLFLKDPLIWLEAISRHRATISGAPNFAYDLCVRKASPERVAQLDLTSWRVAVNGAEPVRMATMERFAECFKDTGFEITSFLPAYGLAEATLMVSSGMPGAVPAAARLAATARLDSGSDNRSSVPAADFVCCGSVIGATDVRIVDPEHRAECPEGAVGEIWVCGPCVAAGYWGHPEATTTTFGALLNGDDEERPFLRTGDLGIVRDGELFVTGRLKDLIIVRGENYYPQDIEETVGQADQRLRPGCAAAFETDLDGRQRIVVVQECAAELQDSDVAEIVSNVRRAVATDHGLAIDEVVLIARGTSLKTSSGKIRRQPTRAAYLRQELEIVATDQPRGASLDAAVGTDGERTVQSIVVKTFAEILATTASLDEDFFALGGDSLSVVEFTAAIEEQLGAVLQPRDVYRFPTPRLLAREIISTHPGVSTTGTSRPSQLLQALRTPIPRVDDALSYPLCPIQRRWATDYLGDRSKTWGNLSVRVPLPDAGSLHALEEAIQTVWEAHESLRTVFPFEDGELMQRVMPSVEVPAEWHDLTNLPADERLAAGGSVIKAEASTVFDLATGPTARAALIRTGDSTAEVHIALHHMLADGWSVIRLREELAQTYERIVNGEGPMQLPSSPVRYRDYATWMLALEDSHALTDARDYWLGQLDGDIPDTMPVNDAVARGDDTKGASVLRILPSELAARVKRHAQSTRLSVTALLYAAFFSVIQRRTGKHDLIIGTPLAGRDRPDIRDVVGMFINLVPIRLRFRRGWDFADVVEATQAQLLGAMVNQRYQLDKMVGDLGVAREAHQFPITNTFFTKLDMMGASLGQQAGATIAAKLATDVRFHMMMYAYEFTDGLILECKYRDVLFDDEDVARIVADCVGLLDQVIGT